MPDSDVQDLRQRLRRMFPAGTELDDGVAVVEVRDARDEVVLLLRRRRDPRLYGIPVPLGDTSEDFYYTGYAVASVEEWLESVDVGLLIHMGTGFWASARRAAVDDYIELRADGGWPHDDRFYFQVLEPMDPFLLERASAIAASGMDPTVAAARRDVGRLICWVTASANNATAGTYVAQAVVSWTGDTTAHLELVEVADGAPISVLVDAAHLAAHAAGAAGALSVSTDLDAPELRIAGFRVVADGRRQVDTSFLDEDPAAAAALIERSRGEEA